MGIRIIGSQPVAAIRIQPTSSGDGGGESGGQALDFRPVGEQRTIDEPDNIGESDVDGQDSVIDPSVLDSSSGGGNSGSPTGKRRGRKPGSRNKSGGNATKRDTSKATDTLNSILFSAHMMLANIMKMPQIEIDLVESAKLADAVNQVTEFYDVSIGNEEQRAWFNLIMVAGGIYIPRAFGGKVVRRPASQQQAETMPPKQPIPMPSFMVNGSGKPM